MIEMNRIYNEDCLSGFKDVDSNSIDLIVTDPPYKLTPRGTNGSKILDTHLGSGSSRIAAYNLGFDFVGCEIDEDYFKAQEERFKAHTAQQSLFI